MSDQVMMATIPDCDLPHPEPVKAVVDAKTRMGPWAYMCQAHFEQFGLGRLGTGYGQLLVQAEPVKTAKDLL